MMIDPPPSRVRRCLIFGFTSHILKIRQQTTVLTQRIHMNTKLSTTISYSLNNLLHYVCVPVHKKNNNKTTWLQRKRQNVHTYYTGNRKNGLAFQRKLFNGRSLMQGYQALAWVQRFLFYSCTTHNASTSVRTHAMKLHKQFYHFKYSLRVDENIWGEYYSFFKPST